MFSIFVGERVEGDDVLASAKTWLRARGLTGVDTRQQPVDFESHDPSDFYGGGLAMDPERRLLAWGACGVDGRFCLAMAEVDEESVRQGRNRSTWGDWSGEPARTVKRRMPEHAVAWAVRAMRDRGGEAAAAALGSRRNNWGTGLVGQFGSGKCTVYEMAPDGASLFCGYSDGNTLEISLETNQVLYVYHGHRPLPKLDKSRASHCFAAGSIVSSITFSPDNTKMLIAHLDGIAVLWDVKSKTVLWEEEQTSMYISQKRYWYGIAHHIYLRTGGEREIYQGFGEGRRLTDAHFTSEGIIITETTGVWIRRKRYFRNASASTVWNLGTVLSLGGTTLIPLDEAHSCCQEDSLPPSKIPVVVKNGDSLSLYAISENEILPWHKPGASLWPGFSTPFKQTKVEQIKEDILHVSEQIEKRIHRNDCSVVAILENGTRALLIGQPIGRFCVNIKSIEVWDTISNTMLISIDSEKYFLGLSSDGRMMLLADGNTLRHELWDIGSGQCVSKFSNAASSKFSPDGKAVLLLEELREEEGKEKLERVIRVWDILTGKEKKTLDYSVVDNSREETRPDDGCRSLPRTDSLYVDIDEDGYLFIRETRSGRVLEKFPYCACFRHDYCAEDDICVDDGIALDFSVDGRVLLLTNLIRKKYVDAETITEMHSAIIRDFSNGLRFVLETYNAAISTAALSPDGSLAATGNIDREVKLWDATTGKLLATLLAGYPPFPRDRFSVHVKRLSFIENGSRLLAELSDGMTYLWDVGAQEDQYSSYSVDYNLLVRILDHVDRTGQNQARLNYEKVLRGQRDSFSSKANPEKITWKVCEKGDVWIALQILSTLVAAIVSGELLPGQQLPTTERIATACGTTSSSVRQAVKYLKVNGIIHHVSGRGYIVGLPFAKKWVREKYDGYCWSPWCWGPCCNSMHWRLDRNSMIPLYQQIESHVQSDISSGKLKPGDRLPAVRELAKRLKVNGNTVSKAYRDLVVTGLLYTLRGEGVYVARP